MLYRYGTKLGCRRDRGSQGGGSQGGDHESCRGDIFRRRGIARKLLRHVSNKWAPAQDVELLRICTGTSAAGPMMLYQQEGFDLVAVDRDYFVRNYAEPIWENCIQCRHQLILEKRLK